MLFYGFFFAKKFGMLIADGFTQVAYGF